jgi:hypothetical protein
VGEGIYWEFIGSKDEGRKKISFERKNRCSKYEYMGKLLEDIHKKNLLELLFTDKKYFVKSNT